MQFIALKHILKKNIGIWNKGPTGIPFGYFLKMPHFMLSRSLGQS
jgi:hypothetical protein